MQIAPQPNGCGGRVVLGSIVDVVDDLADRFQFLGIVIRDKDLELLLQLHDQFDDVQRIGVQVLRKVGVPGHVDLFAGAFACALAGGAVAPLKAAPATGPAPAVPALPRLISRGLSRPVKGQETGARERRTGLSGT